MSAKTTDETRRAGALACIAALRRLVEAASQPIGNKAADFFTKQHGDAQAFAASLGSMPPFAEGAIIALAEYIHETETTGTPDLEAWEPEAAKTEAERKRHIAAIESTWNEEDRRSASW